MVVYNDDIPYDYIGLYDDASVYIYPPSKAYVLNEFLPLVSSGKSIAVPTEVLLLSGYTPLISTGVSIKPSTVALTLTGGGGYYIVETLPTSGGPIPASHISDAQKLEADAIVELFQIILRDGTTKIFLKNNHDQSWQGNDYEGTVIRISGVSNFSDETVSRPRLEVSNPEGIFSYFIEQGLINNATVVRYRVLKPHLDDDLPIYRRQQWKVSRVSSLTNKSITLELRDMLDGQVFMTPGRMFIPPYFPTVSLS